MIDLAVFMPGAMTLAATMLGLAWMWLDRGA